MLIAIGTRITWKHGNQTIHGIVEGHPVIDRNDGTQVTMYAVWNPDDHSPKSRRLILPEQIVHVDTQR